MTIPGPGLAPGSRFKVPRRTVRLRLTLLYGSLFLAAGAGLLAITYLLVAHWLANHIFYVNGQTGTGVRVGIGDALLQELSTVVLNELLLGSGIALAIMAVAATGLGWLVAGHILRPLQTMTATTRRISEHNLHQRLAARGPADELKDLSDTIDGLLARLEAAFDAQRQFVANASHELRTPLTTERTILEVALANPHTTLDSLRAACRDVLATEHQQERLIEALLTLARSQRGLDHREPCDLAAITATVVHALQAEARGRQLGLDITLGAALTPGDPRLIERLVANLADNALRYNTPGGRVAITTGTTAGHAVVTVTNTGAPVPATQISRLFEPFQRLDADRVGAPGGLGLGLSIIAAIAHAHGAGLKARARTAGGLKVEVSFPALADRDGSPVSSERRGMSRFEGAGDAG
jgi:signal transduction histidine kinase